MKRKGFTLIELLAVIVILAVISLIAVPVMLNVIERVRKGAFEDTAYGIIDAAKLYYADTSLDKGVTGEIFTFPNDTKLKLTGEKPKSGSVILEEDGKVSLAISNGVWCAKKGKEEEKVTIVDYSIGNCEIGETNPSAPETCFTVSDADPSEITGYICDENDIEIPGKIDGNVIRKIGNSSFREKQLTSVKIPEGIESIGKLAFYSNQLTSIRIPESVTVLGESAFYGNQLTNVVIPKSIAKIAIRTFAHNKLVSVTIPNGITSIGEAAFSYNELTSANLADSIIAIDKNAFYENQLTSIKIPENTTTIANTAFAHNQLTNVIMKEGLTDIGDATFAYNQLANIELPSTITNIGPSAFSNNQSGMKVFVNREEDSILGAPWGATSVEWKKSCFTVSEEDPSVIMGYICDYREIEIPTKINGVTIKKIGGSGAFYKRGLTSVKIPEGITSIGSSAFYGNELTNIDIPESVTEIGNAAFYWNQLTSVTIKGQVSSIGDRAFAYNQLSSVTILNGVTKIEEAAFKGNQLISIRIPESVTEIGNEAFNENQEGMKVTINKEENSITGAPWGATSVEWVK